MLRVVRFDCHSPQTRSCNRVQDLRHDDAAEVELRSSFSKLPTFKRSTVLQLACLACLACRDNSRSWSGWLIRCQCDASGKLRSARDLIGAGAVR